MKKDVEEVAEDSSSPEDRDDNTFVRMFKQSRRYELSLRFGIGYILPLALTFGGFYRSSTVTWIPIFYVVLACGLPPYMSSAVLAFGLLVSGMVLALAAATSVVAVGSHTQNEGLAYLTIFGWVLFTAPWWTGKFSTMTRFFVIVFAAILVFAYVATLDLVFKGRIFGFVEQSAEEASCDYAKLLPQGDFLQQVAQILCDDLVKMTTECADWPTEVLSKTQYAYLNEYLSKEQICLEVDGDYVFVVITRKTLWICQLLWGSANDQSSIASGLLTSLTLAVLCYVLALFLPPQRYIGDHIQAGMLQSVLACRQRLGKLLSGEALDIESFIEFHDSQLVSAMISGSTMAGMECHIEDPGPAIAYYPQLKTVATQILEVQNYIYFYAVSQGEKLKTEEMNCLRICGQLLNHIADAISLRPTVGKTGKHTFTRMKLMLDEDLEDLKNELPGLEAIEQRIKKQVQNGGENIQDIEEQLPANTPWFFVAESCLVLKLETDKMLSMMSTPSVKGLLLTLVGLLIIAVLPWIRLFQVYIMGVLKTKKCFKGDEGDRLWKRRDFLYNFQFALACLIIVALTTWALPLRNWLLSPVGMLPAGKLGQWAMVPIFNVLQPTLEGTMKRGHLRIIGTCFGALFGYCASLALSYGSVVGCCFILVFTVMASLFVGAEPDEDIRFSFNRSYGYSFQLVTWTSVVITLEWASSCSKFADPASKCQYTPGHMTAIRVIGQALGIVVAIAVAHFILPRPGGVTVRELLCDVVKIETKYIERRSAARKINEQATEEDYDPKGEETVQLLLTECKTLHQNTEIFDEMPIYKKDSDIPTLIHLVEELRLLSRIIVKDKTYLEDRHVASELNELVRLLASTTTDCMGLNGKSPITGRRTTTPRAQYCYWFGHSTKDKLGQAIQRHSAALDQLSRLRDKFQDESLGSKAILRLTDLYSSPYFSRALTGQMTTEEGVAKPHP